MIVILKRNTTEEQTAEFIERMGAMGYKTHLSRGENTTIVGLIGDTSRLDTEKLRSEAIVSDVKRVTEPYKKANRKFHESDTVIDIKGRKLGGGNFQVIAGPCSVEDEEQIGKVAESVLTSGAGLLRGGAYKPRTSPYSFQGLESEGLRMLAAAGKKTGLPIVTEIMDPSDIELFGPVDVIQVGARNMQNFRLLKLLGQTDKPILLKRGLANTLEELLMSAEYIMSEGNERVILCERGIRTFEPSTRNTLDISAVPMLKSLTHLPVIVDPSHAGGISWLVEPLSKAAVAAGADGLMIEVHNDPRHAKSDGAQSLTPADFAQLMRRLRPYVELEGKTLWKA
jgi:3-deoxy-7-phosphoheptulonate synthase